MGKKINNETTFNEKEYKKKCSDSLNQLLTELSEEDSHRKLSAREARLISDNALAFRKRIFKSIKQSAYDGETEVHYLLNYVSTKAIESLIKELTDLGYEASVENNELAICW